MSLCDSCLKDHTECGLSDANCGGPYNCPKCNGTGVSPLRRAIMAPPGHVIVVRDLSAIEARVNAWLCGQDDMVDIFRRGECVYCDMYRTISGIDITKKDKNERFLGKTVVLGCGYGLGWKKFQSMLRVGMLGDSGRVLGQDIADSLGVNLMGFLHRNIGYVRESLPPGVDEERHALHCACAQKIILTFRDNKPMIPKFWDRCHEALGQILQGEETWFGGPNGDVLKTTPQGILLPNGMMINYVELEGKKKGRRIEYKVLKDRRKGEWGKVYGGLVDENCVQALSRIILTDNMLKVSAAFKRKNSITSNLSTRKYIRKVAHQVHDEILTVVPEQEAEETYDMMGHIMSTPPAWGPDIPLASEGGWNRSYIK